MVGRLDNGDGTLPRYTVALAHTVTKYLTTEDDLLWTKKRAQMIKVHINSPI